jgi:hypothetical protein
MTRINLTFSICLIIICSKTKTNAHGNEDPRLRGGSVKPDNAIPYLHPMRLKYITCKRAAATVSQFVSPTCGINGYQQ